MNTGNVASQQQVAVEFMQSVQASIMGGSQAMAGSDAFAQLLMQLMGGTQQDMAQLLLGMQEMTQDSEEEGTHKASQMLAQLLAGGGITIPHADWMMQALSTQQQPVAVDALNMQQQATGEAATAQSALADLLGASLTQEQQPVQQMNVVAQTQVQQTMQKDLTPANPQQMAPAADSQEKEAAPLPITMATGTSTDKGGDTQTGLGGQSQFLNAISQAKKQMGRDGGTDNGKQETLFVDVEQLQRAVNTGKYAAVKTPQSLDESLQARDLMGQVKTGIQQNLLGGKNEFVVRLKPDGLGEIVVKMVETGSKIALTIEASNAQVAKMLNSGMVELREALRPFNADVHEVVQQQAYSQDGAYQQAFGEQEQRQTHGREHRQQGHMPGQDADVPVPEEDRIHSRTAGLNTYI